MAVAWSIGSAETWIMAIEVTIHKLGDMVCLCPGPTRSGCCSLQVAAGLPLQQQAVPCAGRALTVKGLGSCTEWEVADGATVCFIPPLGLIPVSS
jgi:hypothetical protein